MIWRGWRRLRVCGLGCACLRPRRCRSAPAGSSQATRLCRAPARRRRSRDPEGELWVHSGRLCGWPAADGRLLGFVASLWLRCVLKATPSAFGSSLAREPCMEKTHGTGKFPWPKVYSPYVLRTISPHEIQNPSPPKNRPRPQQTSTAPGGENFISESPAAPGRAMRRIQ